MILTKQKVIIEQITPTQEAYSLLERIGRVCYKSENRITEDSATKFIKGIVARNHLSVIEHCIVTIRFITNRGVSHELVRHRIASFSQECVTGDTIVRKSKGKNITIKQLYERKSNQYGRTHNKTIKLRSVNEDGLIVENNMSDVFYKGIQPVYEITTSLGYKIKTTLNHKFKIKNGEYIELKNINVDDELFVNGRPCLIKISDEELVLMYDKNNPTEISEKLGIPYRSVILRLKKLGVFIKHKNDKNKEKYQNNHTKESIDKMRKKIKEGFLNGRVVWNKGLSEHENDSVKIQAKTLRENHHNNGREDKNSNWSGGILTWKDKRKISGKIKKSVSICELCGAQNKKLDVHHIDKDIGNYNEKNLIKVCCNCHKLLHHGWHVGTKQILDKVVSIKYVGEEETYDISMNEPYHNYVANGFITHNSTRFCNYNKQSHVEFIIPHWLDVKEGVFSYNDLIPGSLAPEQIFLYSLLMAEEAYNTLIAGGKKPEDARDILPIGVKTELVMTANLREWLLVCNLRTAKAAHPNMRQVMSMVLDALQLEYPEIFGIGEANEA